VKKKLSYSLYDGSDDQLGILALGPGEERRYRLAWTQVLAPSESLEGDRAKALARDRESKLQVIAGSHVEHQIASAPRLKGKELERAIHGIVAREQGDAQQKWAVTAQVLPDNGTSETLDVSVLYAPQERVDEHLARAAGAGVQVGAVLPSYAVLDRFFRDHRSSDEEITAWSLVYLGENERFLVIGSVDNIVMTRPLPEYLYDDANADEYVARLTTEVERSHFFAQQTAGHVQVKDVFVCGPSGCADLLVERLNSESSLAARRWDVAEFFEWGDEQPDFDLIIPLMAAAVAGQVRESLLPPDPNQALSRRLLRSGMSVTVGLFLLLVPLLLAGSFWTTKVQDRYLDEATTRLAAATTRVEQATATYRVHQTLQAREDKIGTLVAGQPDFAALLMELAEATPGAVLFNDLRILERRDKQYVLYLSGESIATTVVGAQTAFLQFMAAVTACERLEPLGEPTQLHIKELDDAGDDKITVVFSLDCLIKRG